MRRCLMGMMMLTMKLAAMIPTVELSRVWIPLRRMELNAMMKRVQTSEPSADPDNEASNKERCMTTHPEHTYNFGCKRERREETERAG
ncbi:hypothetical protein PAHAL_6G018700 [Panicum hallii]|uniref:Secreted protein n=1 Tax=Panicum hallii TaxID=206008 RepID=A0A2T8IEV0_9POAL|nr:hypothetical protein PAHAL_6G018700 [Panicum hallii]